MNFSREFLEEIRRRVPCSRIIGERVKLSRVGREFKGFSPFGGVHEGSPPTLFVSDARGFYKDFASGKSGDIFTFVMETEGLSFHQAVEKLAAVAGVPLPSAEGEVWSG